MADSVAMTHPDLPDAEPATATRQQFELVWKAQGWREAKADDGKRRKTTTQPQAAESAAAPKE